MTKPATLTVGATVENLARIAEFLEKTLHDAGCPEETIFSVQLAVDEAGSNVMLYGYPDGDAGTLTVTCEVREGTIRLTLTDDGRPFDPLTIEPPDLDADLEHRKIGGLGIHFMRSVMDDVGYDYIDGKNVLCMIKREGGT
ncbi:ATP-binding protein [Methanoculleus sp. FWC-SCC1]|uniref:ATP-binding protein n=1 Tax=Methanoculleus frigidifontis TaxID=2584085 RepID=A0ABT8MAC8_9EURY|nr:ATP-binding protein [Methanoculleus sp. FWC-SCC1]MDN7024894.1 ATP-binding protein [Methanoculleus sp. FWC-SCC1]